jgi:thiol-disulfide isomerase/thioredoxin
MMNRFQTLLVTSMVSMFISCHAAYHQSPYDIKILANTKRGDHAQSIDDFFNDLIGHKQFVVVRFVMNHCPACESTEGLFTRIARQYDHEVTFIEINYDEFPRISKHKVKSFPSYLFLNYGQLVHRAVHFTRQADFEAAINTNFNVSKKKSHSK